ncbi:MAG: hypothetical protein LBJ73_04835 [Rickettsiales bacterium]|nr:hypothetical protein [Rickettsiales bacterium]
MRHTSDKNLQKILEFNHCATPTILNARDRVSINIFELNGYINLADFTRGALALYIYCYFAGSNLRHRHELDKEAAELAKKNKNRIDLDASHAGDFAFWSIDRTGDRNNTAEETIIRSIKLRHENQVFRAGCGNGFPIQQESLYNMLKQAKIDARHRNIEKYANNARYQPFHNDLNNIRQFYECIKSQEADIAVISRQIEELNKKVRAGKNQIESLNATILESVQNIIKKNAESEYCIPIHEISSVKPETRSVVNDDSGDQAYSYAVMSDDAIAEMKRRNAQWYKILADTKIDSK